MTWKPYDYTTRRHAKGKYLSRPLLDIEVSAEGNTETITALVDSGSETTVMSAEIALILGITPQGKQTVKIAGFGQRDGFVATVKIVVPEFPKEVLATDVVFVNGVSSDFPFDVLLGQDDFFRRFHIRFERDQSKFFLKVA